jgi:hypothetical protein
MKNMSSGRFSAGPHHQAHSAALGGILDSSGLLLFADLNLLDFSIYSILQEKVEALPHANLATLRPSIATE